MTPKPLEKFVIPAGTYGRSCNGEHCDDTLYFITNPRTGRRIPVSVDEDDPECFHPTRIEEGMGVPHHAVCPDVEAFRKARESNR